MAFKVGLASAFAWQAVFDPVKKPDAKPSSK